MRAGAGVIRRRGDRVDLLCDSEIEKPRRPVRPHQDIGGLQVPVNHTVLMRVLDRFDHGAKQVQTLFHGAVALPGIRRERDAVHVFHYEPRCSVTERPGVVQAGDRRMI